MPIIYEIDAIYELGAVLTHMISTSRDQHQGLTWRILFIVILIAPINCYFLIQMELVRYTFPTWVVPLSNVIFILVTIIIVNLLLSWIWPSSVLRADELIVLYVMLSLTTTMAGCDMLQAVLSVLGHGFWFATEENEWKELFWDHLPRWLTVSDRSVLHGYYTGDSNLYLPHHLKVWIPVLLGWLFLFFTLAIIFLCLNTILRRQWADRERLTFPIIQLPLEMTNSSSVFFRNKRMWLGIGIASSIGLLNGLSVIYPSLPSLPITRRSFSFSELPLSLYGGITVAFYPFAIGIMFLMPIDVLFSTALFYFLYRNEVALAEAMGWRGLPKFPYLDQQTFGAFVGLCIFFIWIGKHHFRQVLTSVLRQPTGIDDMNQPIRYQTAFWGLCGGLFLFAFALYKAGMTFWIAIIFAVLFLITPIITTRIRAESGIFVHAYHWLAPRYALGTILGTRRLGPQNLTVLSVCFFNRDYRPQQMPHQLEAFKLAETTGISQKRMMWAILISTAIGILVAFWVQLHMYYQKGANSGYFGPWALGYGREYFRRLTNWISYPTNTDWVGVLFMGIGFFIMMILTYLRVKFFWLPLHPLGYVMASNQEMSDLWAPILICLALKWTILKHGGIRSYRHAVPFFLGLVLGDYLMGIVWSLLSVLLNAEMYQFYP